MLSKRKGRRKESSSWYLHNLTNGWNPCVFRSDGVFGNHRIHSAQPAYVKMRDRHRGSHNQRSGYSRWNSRVSRNTRADPNPVRLPRRRGDTRRFVEGFPTVTRESAVAALEEAK